MTPEALPTPYDITPLPGLPLVPALWVWAALLLLALAVMVLVAGLPQRKRRFPNQPAFDDALAALASIEKAELVPNERLALSSLAARRLLTTLSGADLRSLTASELSLTAGLPDGLLPVVEVTAEIEAARFTPSLSSHQASELARKLADALRRSSDSYSLPKERG